MKKRLIISIVGVLAATAGAGIYYRATRPPDEPTVVTVAVARGDVVEAVDATGTLQAVTTVQVGTQVSGTIKALHADFNSRVHRGQVIAELDPSLLATQVEQSRATVTRLEADADRIRVQLEDAQTKLKRARELSQRQLIPPTDLEAADVNVRETAAALVSAQAQTAQARASLNQSQVNFDHTVITAPIDGIVISRNVDVGQTVAASMQAPVLFVIARDLTQMQVNASVSESDIGRIRAGQRVSFRVDAYPSEAFTGTVSQVRLEPVVQQNVVSYITVINVANPNLKLKPGMTANVTVEIERATGVLRVPTAALRIRPSAAVLAAFGDATTVPTASAGAHTSSREERGTAGAGPVGASRAQVWVLSKGGLRRVPVSVGITDGTSTAIVGGALEEGAEVVTSIATQAGAVTAGSPLLPLGGARRGGGAGGAGRTPAGGAR